MTDGPRQLEEFDDEYAAKLAAEEPPEPVEGAEGLPADVRDGTIADEGDDA